MINLIENGASIRFGESGLVPAIIQDANTKSVLMLGYMNQEAVNLTQSTGLATFFSRSRGCIWQKGETSGNTLKVSEMRLDCDGDTILVQATPDGPTCHTGSDTCWNTINQESSSIFLTKLEKIIEDRLLEGDEASYTVRLVKEGIKKVSQKVGEEGVETALEGVAGNDEKLVEEASELVYHLLVLLKARHLSLSDVTDVLARRHGAPRRS